MYPACLYVNAQGRALGQNGIVQVLAGIVYLFLVTTVGQRIRRITVGTVGQNDIKDVETWRVTSCRTDADDVLHVVFCVEFVGIDADAGHPHSTGLNADRHAFVAAGIA